LRDGFGGRPEGFGDSFQTTETRRGYEKPLVVLINSGSRSARELLSYQLRKSGRATLIGRNTAGFVLGTAPIRINAWSTLEIPQNDIRVDGIRFEGLGVAPDIVVPEERDSTGIDLDLQEAVRYLGRPAQASLKSSLVPLVSRTAAYAVAPMFSVHRSLHASLR
jgi:C-terminal processing protease CtpA/Prc